MRDDRIRTRRAAVMMMLAIWLVCALVHAQEPAAPTANAAPVPVVDANRVSQNLLFATAVADLGDLDGDGVTDVLSGRIHFAPSGGIYGGDGQVFVLSGETGRILNVFDERNYPTISLEHYLALHDR